jgi:hypothetical protein
MNQNNPCLDQMFNRMTSYEHQYKYIYYYCYPQETECVTKKVQEIKQKEKNDKIFNKYNLDLYNKCLETTK